MEFSYTALNKSGQKESGTIQAASEISAGHQLREQGLLPVRLARADRFGGMDFLRNITTISLDEKINFIENLGIMLKAGISISRALQIQVKQTHNLKMKNILTDIYNQVEQGKGLSEALEKYPTIFSNIFFSMIKVGEMSGNLEKSLAYLTNQLHREADLKSKVKGAMIYPSVIMSAMVIIGVLMSIFVLPKLTSIFKEFKTELPLSTRIVMKIADVMGGNAVLVLVGLSMAIAAVIVFHRTPQGKRFFDFIFLHFLVIGGIVKKVNLARLSRILSSLLKSGIPIVQSLEVASQSLGNTYYRELMMSAASAVKVGKPLADSLGKDTGLFPVLVVQMIQVGEESGTVEEILDQLAMHYEEEVDTTLKNLSSIIEPLLLLFIGGVVGVLAIALISPIYNISESIK